MLTWPSSETIYHCRVETSAHCKWVSDKRSVQICIGAIRPYEKPNRAKITCILKSLPPSAPAKAGKRIYKTIQTTRGHDHVPNTALYGWVCDMFSKRLNLSHALIRQKSYRIAIMLNAWLHSTSYSSLKFSEAWMSKFYLRWKLRTVKSHS